jgi:hypothetical protein
MSSDDESSTARPEPRYQLRSNTQSFEPISLSSRSSHGTIKHPQHHRHLVQLLPGIQVTLHQQYIKVHLEGQISGVRLLLHLLSHHHRILRCKL